MLSKLVPGPTKCTFKNILFIFQTLITETSRNPSSPMRCWVVNEPSWELGIQAGNQGRAITVLFGEWKQTRLRKRSHQCLVNYRQVPPSATTNQIQTFIQIFPTPFLISWVSIALYCLIKRPISKPSFKPSPQHLAAILQSIMFDPTAMPIRSCIRPIDELISNCGPPDKKTCVLLTQPPINLKQLRHIRELGGSKEAHPFLKLQLHSL